MGIGPLWKSLCAAALLAACAEPTITGASGDHITLRYDPALATRQDMVSRATEYCEANGHTGGAQLDASSQRFPGDWINDTFRCLDAETPPQEP